MRVKMSKQPPPAPTASAVGPCPTVIKIVGRPGTEIQRFNKLGLAISRNINTVDKP